MILYITRHGETKHNKNKVIQGHNNTELNRVGTKQAKLLAKRLSEVNFDYIYSSDLQRAKKTTDEIMKFQNCPVEYVRELRERDFGLFTNKAGVEYLKFLEQNKIADNSKRLPNGVETLYKMYKRLDVFFKKIYKKHKHQTILFSTHNGPKIAYWLKFNGLTPNGFSYEKRFDNTSITIVQCREDDNHKIILENCTKHLNKKTIL